MSSLATDSAIRAQPWAPISFLECITKPLIRDWPVYAGGTLFFVCQYGSKFVMNRMSKKFRKLSDKDKDTWSVRFVSCVNSVLCSVTAYNYVFKAPGLIDRYDTIPGQVTMTELLVCYFIWDIVVCIVQGWEQVFLWHGCVSCLITHLACLPYIENHHGHYSGMFELSNIFLHLAIMLEMLDNTAPKLQIALKSVFSLIFIPVRPIMGTYVTYVFTKETYNMYQAGWPKCHNPTAAVVINVGAMGLMLLQYIFTKSIIEGLLVMAGLMTGPEEPTSPKSIEKKHQDDVAEMETAVRESAKTK